MAIPGLLVVIIQYEAFRFLNTIWLDIIFHIPALYGNAHLVIYGYLTNKNPVYGRSQYIWLKGSLT